MESRLLRHEPCPRCRQNGNDRRGNNLGVYTDHVYCFACGYSRKTKFPFIASKRQSVDQQRNTVSEQSSKNVLHRPILPSDTVLSLPSVALDWVKQYGITDREIAVNKLGWSDNGITVRGQPYKPCLVFPVFDGEGSVLMYQCRYFGTDKAQPKYVTRGNPNDILHILGNDSSTITVTEDLLSAIKVSRYGTSMPIWGSYIQDQVAVRLSKRYSYLNIWLDYDKTKEAHKMQRRLSLYFREVKVISTFKDPKDSDGETIRFSIKTAT